MGDDNQPLRLGTYLQEDAPLFGIDGLQGLRLPPTRPRGRLQRLTDGFHEVVVEALGVRHKIVHVLVDSRY